MSAASMAVKYLVDTAAKTLGWSTPTSALATVHTGNRLVTVSLT